MSGDHEQLATELRTNVLAAVAELTKPEQDAVHLVADTIRKAIADGEMQQAGLGHLALALASIELQQSASEIDATATGSTL